MSARAATLSTRSPPSTGGCVRTLRAASSVKRPRPTSRFRLHCGDESIVVVPDDVHVVGRVHEALHVLQLPTQGHAYAGHDELVLAGLEASTRGARAARGRPSPRPPPLLSGLGRRGRPDEAGVLACMRLGDREWRRQS